MKDNQNEDNQSNRKRDNEIQNTSNKLVVVIKKKQKLAQELNITSHLPKLNRQVVINFEEFDFQNEKIINNLKNADLLEDKNLAFLVNTNEEAIEGGDLNPFEMKEQEILKIEKTRNELKLMKVSELRDLVENLKFQNKTQIHWSWLQTKSDIIDLLMDSKNPKYQKKK